MVGSERLVPDDVLAARRRHAGPGLGVHEQGVDEGQDLRRRAIGDQQRHTVGPLSRRDDVGDIALGLVKQPARICALEAVDRLLLVADHEQGAVGGPLLPKSGPGPELAGQPPDDVPLLGRGVLGLVDQDMVDAAVQLVEHPGGVRPLVDQLARAADQIGEVQRAAAGLGLMVGLGIGAGHGQDLDRGLGDPRRPQVRPDLLESVLLGQQGHADVLARLQRLGRCVVFDRRAFSLFSEEGEERVADGFHRPEAPGALAVRDAPCLQHLGRFIVEATVERGHGGLRDRFRAGRRLEATDLPDVRLHAFVAAAAFDVGGDGVAPVLEIGEQLVEGLEIEGDGQPGVGVGKRTLDVQGIARHGGPRLAGDQGRGLVIHDLEGRRHAGLQRKAAQQLLAEGVDGLDLQPAGRFQRLGEQGAGVGQADGVAGRGLALQPDQRRSQLLVLHDRPAAEHVEQPALHLGGGGLGVGHAEDGGRLYVAQQQPGHPIDQGLGLARAGVGGDEGVERRIGRLTLMGVLEAHSSPSPSLPVDHSKTRARWS